MTKAMLVVKIQFTIGTTKGTKTVFIARYITSIPRPKGNISGMGTIYNWHTKGNTKSFYPRPRQDIYLLYTVPKSILVV